MKFYLIQRGKFNKDGNGLTGRDGVVDLDYMGSAEFEFGAIPRSFRRIMHDFDSYVYTSTGIYTKENNELILFSNQELSNEILEGLASFINNPYHLKEYSDLEKISRIANLAGCCNLTVCVDDEKNIENLSRAATLYGTTINCLVELNIGANRCGVNSKEEVLNLAKKLIASPGLSFEGIQAYAGQISHQHD